MMNIERRDFLKMFGVMGAVGVSSQFLPSWMPRLAFAQDAHNATGEVMVCIFLRGGIDGLSAVIPVFEGANYYDARPTQSIAEPNSRDDSSVNLDGNFALHPAMRPLKDIFDNQDLAIIHATGSIDDTRSHFDAMLYMEHGTPGDKSTTTGWVGRHLQATASRSNSPFRAVGMGAMLPTSLRGPVSALSLQSITDFHLRGREDEAQRMLQTLSQLYQVNAPQQIHEHQAKLVFDTMAQLDQINALDYVPANGADYPESEFGMGMKQIAQLAKADVGLEVACIDIGGWDTHENQGTLDGDFSQLITDLSQGLHAFYADLGEMNRRVTVVTMSEFGRRVTENASGGTDHGHGNFMMLMGGAVNGGQVYTDWPGLSSDKLDDGDLAITTDYRDVLAEVLQHRLHNDDMGFVFPNHSVKSLGLVNALS